MGPLMLDLRFGFRMLAKAHGFTAVAALTLALGLSANTAIFTLIDAYTLRPLPRIKHPERLVRIETIEGGDDAAFSHAIYKLYIENNQVFSALAAFRDTEFQLGGDGEPERKDGACVSSNYFSVLGVTPALGRWFFPQEDEIPGAYPVTVLSYRLWSTRYDSDANIIGKDVILNGHHFTVVGVAAKNFRGIEPGKAFDVWVPLAMFSQAMPDVVASFGSQQFLWLNLLGRLKPRLSLSQAQASFSLTSQQLQLAYPQNQRQEHVILVQNFKLRVSGFEGILFAAVGLLLCVACANIANLLLARNSTRRMEFAMRRALGASRGRLARQLLIEGILISILGCAAAIISARWEAQLLLPLLNSGVPVVDLDLGPDLRVVALTLAISILATIASSLAPVAQAANLDLAAEFKKFSPEGKKVNKSSLRNFLVVFQLALSLVLLSSTALLFKTLQNIDAIKPDFQTRNILLATVQPGMQGYNQEHLSEFYTLLQHRIESLPGVQAAGLATDVLVGGFFRQEVAVEGHEPPIDEKWINLEYDCVSPNYFRTVGLGLVGGRELGWSDTAAGPKVLVLNESAGRELFGNSDPVGRFIRIKGEREPREIVGLVKDVWDPGIWETSPANIYFPLLQDHPWWRSAVTIQVRTIANPLAEVPAIRHAAWSIDKNLPVFDVTTMEQHLRESEWAPRTANAVMGVAGILALLLTSAGVYGVMSLSVAQRTHEIGIRMALGAQPADVLRLVLIQGMKLALAGVAVGLLASLGLTRFLGSLLFGVRADDPLAFFAPSAVLILVTMLASYLPARKGMRMDPIVAVRAE